MYVGGARYDAIWTGTDSQTRLLWGPAAILWRWVGWGCLAGVVMAATGRRRVEGMGGVLGAVLSLWGEGALAEGGVVWEARMYTAIWTRTD